MAVTISKPDSSFRRPFLFFLIFGLGFGWTLYIAYQQYRIKSWPQTEATILTFDPGTDHPDWDENWYANPKIQYEYTVNGLTYRSTRINPSPLNYQSPHAFASDMNRLRKGAVVPCWYNPATHHIAYIVNRGVTTGTWVFMLIAGSMLTLGFVSIFKRKTLTMRDHNLC